MTKLPSYMSVMLSIISVAIALTWTDPNTAMQLGMSSSAVRTHAVLMIIGFYVCQNLAINSMILTPESGWKGGVHAVLTTSSFISMIVSIAIMTKYSRNSKLSRFTTLHSWYGLAAFGLFGVCYATGTLVTVIFAY